MEGKVQGRELGLGRARRSRHELGNAESNWVLSCGLVAPVGTSLGGDEWQRVMLSRGGDSLVCIVLGCARLVDSSGAGVKIGLVISCCECLSSVSGWVGS